MTSPIRVGMIIHDYLPHIGGAERQLASVAPYLIERGVDITVLTRHQPGLPFRETMGGVAVHRGLMLPSKPLASMSYMLSTLAALRRIKPDLLHVYGLFSTASTAILAKNLLGVPVVLKLLRGGPKLGDIDRLRQKLLGHWRLEKICGRVDGFITISTDLADELHAIGVPASICHEIPNGVDTDRFRPIGSSERAELRHTLGLPPEAPIVVFSGRLEKEKRVDRLLRLWPRIRDQHHDATLVIVGHGSQTKSLAANAPPGVLLIGAVDDVSPYLRTADVFVLPSIAEGLSNALLEALACGLPAVVSDLLGNRQLIDDGVNGFLVRLDDEAGLLQTLSQLLTNPLLQSYLGRAARSRIEQDYTLSQTADRLVGLYRTLLDQRRTTKHFAHESVTIDA